jgi:hypothetical protein
MPWVPRPEGARRLNQGLVVSVPAGLAVTPLLFTGLGSAGLLLLASCDAPAWLSLYVSAEAAIADAPRLQSQDPAPEAGVVLDLVFPEGTTVLRLPPGISWANQDDPVSATLHGRLRTDLPAPADVAVALSGVLLVI